MGLLENLPVVLKFCCCINLRPGTIIIGTICLAMLVCSYAGSAAWFLSRYAAQEIDDDQVRIFLAMWFLLLIYVMPKIILNLVLIAGAVKKKSSLLGIYLWSTLVYTVIEALGVVAAVGILSFTDLLTWPIFAAFLSIFVIHLYFWVCIDSYYMTLKLENRFSVRQQMRGAMLTFDPSQSPNSRQQSFPLRRLISKPPHVKPPS